MQLGFQSQKLEKTVKLLKWLTALTGLSACLTLLLWTPNTAMVAPCGGVRSVLHDLLFARIDFRIMISYVV